MRASLPYAYRPKTRYSRCRYIFSSSSSRACGNCGKPCQTLDWPAFSALDKLWVKGPGCPHPCGENPIPLCIRVRPGQFLPGYTVYCAYFSQENPVFDCRKKWNHHHPPKIPTNPQAVDKYPCGRAKPACFRLFLRAGKVMQGLSTWKDKLWRVKGGMYGGVYVI